MVEVAQSDLEVLRLLLILAGSLLLLWWVAQLHSERPDRPTLTSPTCKLHQRPEHLCRDMHDDDTE